MEELYHIIKVFGYKGGELKTSFNLSYEEFILELFDLFDLLIDEYIYNVIDSDLDIILSNSEVLSKLKEASDKGELLIYIFTNSHIYAGDEGTVWQLYQSKDNKIIKLQLTQDILNDVVEKFIISNI